MAVRSILEVFDIGTKSAGSMDQSTPVDVIDVDLCKVDVIDVDLCKASVTKPSCQIPQDSCGSVMEKAVTDSIRDGTPNSSGGVLSGTVPVCADHNKDIGEVIGNGSLAKVGHSENSGIQSLSKDKPTYSSSTQSKGNRNVQQEKVKACSKKVVKKANTDTLRAEFSFMVGGTAMRYTVVDDTVYLSCEDAFKAANMSGHIRNKGYKSIENSLAKHGLSKEASFLFKGRIRTHVKFDSF